MSRTRPPPDARARASAPATVVLPVPPLPVTTCSCTPSQSLSRVLTGIRLSPLRSAPAAALRHSRSPAALARLAPTVLAWAGIVTRLGHIKGGRLGRAQRQRRGVSHARSAPCGPHH